MEMILVCQCHGKFTICYFCCFYSFLFLLGGIEMYLCILGLLLFFWVQRNRPVCLNFSLQQNIRLAHLALHFLHLGFVFFEMQENPLHIDWGKEIVPAGGLIVEGVICIYMLSLDHIETCV